MASIVTLDTFNEVGNKHLKLLNGEAARRLSVGSGWTKLAVGFREMMSREVAGDITGSPRFTYGLCAGPNTPWSNGANAIGFYHQATSYADTAPDADGQGFYLGSSTSWIASLKRAGSIVATSAAIVSSNNDNHPNDRGTARYLRTVVFIVQKGSTNWNVNLVIQLAGGTYFDAGHRTIAQLITALEQMNDSGCYSNLGASYFTLGANPVLTASLIAESTYGYLDSVFFSWDRSNPAGVLISDVFVAKWA